MFAFLFLEISNSWIDKIINFIAADVLSKFLALLVVPVLFFAFGWALRAYFSHRYASATLNAVKRRKYKGLLEEGPGLYLRQVKENLDYDQAMQNGKPVLMIANLKGGVGKTTLSANLAAHFALKRKMNVLLIDLDFQGSLSTMTVSSHERTSVPCKANQLVSGDFGNGRLKGEAVAVSQQSMYMPLTISAISSNYDLAQAENRVLVEWLFPLNFGPLKRKLLKKLKILDDDTFNRPTDIRYTLAHTIHDPNVQNHFDLIIIDTPPRLSTAHIQALCASNYLLVPTILDDLSSEAVARYLSQIKTHKFGPNGDRERAICPHLVPIGVVATMIPANVTKLEGPIKVLSQTIVEADIGTELLPESCFIRQRAPYRECAGDIIAYAKATEAEPYVKLRAEIDQLGDAIWERMKR